MSVDRWLIKDKEWMRERKAQWADIHIRLIHSEKFRKKQLKAYEAYFLKGKEPKWDRAYDDDPIPLVFRLWFDPDQSEDNWNRILESVVNYPDSMTIENSLRDSFKIFQESDNAVHYSGIENVPNGFMIGLEERMFSFLYGDPESSEYIEFNGENFRAVRRFDGGYYINNYRWLDYPKLHNSYKSSQYKLEHWFCKLNDEYCEGLEKQAPNGKSDLKSVLLYLEKVQTYKYLPSDAIDETRAEYCRKVRDILDNLPLPKKMAQWWKEAKAKIDAEHSKLI